MGNGLVSKIKTFPLKIENEHVASQIHGIGPVASEIIHDKLVKIHKYISEEKKAAQVLYTTRN